MKTYKSIVNLQQEIHSSSFSNDEKNTREWEEANVIITADYIQAQPGKLLITTPYAIPLSWLFSKLQEHTILPELIEGNYLYEELALAVNNYHSSEAVNKNPQDLLLCVLEKVEDILDKYCVELFVYGTLMTGEKNHGVMKYAQFLGEDAIENAQLFNLGTHPMLVTGDGVVYGERYSVPLKTVQVLDQIESHPTYYQRGWTCLKSGKRVLVYQGTEEKVKGYPSIPSGRWLSVSDSIQSLDGKLETFNAYKFLSYLRSLDIKLFTEGENLRCSAPKGAVTSTLQAEIVQHKAEILLFLQKTTAAVFKTPTISQFLATIDKSDQQVHNFSQPLTIPLRNNKNSATLSFAQQRLWFLYQLKPDRADYHLQLVAKLTGDLNIPALQQALDTIVARHEVLRTNFISQNNNPIQIIQEIRPVELQIIDLQNQQSSAQTLEIQRLLGEEIQRPFNISQDLMLRSCLLQIGGKEYILLLVIHHIASDGWSMGIISQELSSLYAAFSQDLPLSIPKLPIQYADFAQWQSQYFQGNGLESSLNYWEKHLVGAPQLLSLPTDRPRPAVQTFQGKTVYFDLPGQITEGIILLSKSEKSTLFMTILAALNILLHRYANSEDIVIGTALGNRNYEETQSLIGFFVNTLALRTDISGNPSFRELLHRVKEVSLGAYSHQDLPFEKLVELLQPKRDLSYSPVFQVMLILNEDISQNKIELTGLNSCPWKVDKNAAQFDLTLYVDKSSTDIILGWEYNTDLFDADTIERINGNFQTLLTNIIADPQQRISELPLLTANEQQQLLVEWNNTQITYPQDKCIHHLFEEQVERTPDAVAIIFEQQQLTYRELNHRANQLAHYLQSLGVKPESLVGICVERSLEMVIGLLAIQKAGGAYVPIDPNDPPERTAYKLEDSQVAILLTQNSLKSILPEYPGLIICLDTNEEIFDCERIENPVSGVTSEKLIYIIYTSGSTGKPKGTMNIHKGVVNRILWMQDKYQLKTSDRILQKTPFSFDVSGWEFWWPLITGACLIVAKPEGHKDSQYLIELINSQQITTLHFVPSMLQAFLLDIQVKTCTSLRLVFCSGEALSIDIQEKFFTHLKAELHNLYGPTEAAIDVTFWQCQPGSQLSTVPIGRPVANTQTYILDSYLHPVPIGVAGELYLGGVQLARGYLNRPELTAERFINNPFVEDFQSPYLYKTGDLARYLADGNIEYLGRIDNQVKIRGFRIELGEIENVLDKHPEVEQGVVIVREDIPGNKQLVAYVVSGQSQPTIQELRQFLKTQLPDYMIPSTFVILEALPLTPNGKVDRRALPIPDNSRQASEETFVLPRNQLELQLTQIWQQLLGIPVIGVKDNFFEIGGHSLLAVRLLSEIQNKLGINLPLATFFTAQTVEKLADILSQGEKSVSWSSLVPIQTAGTKPPLFLIHAIWGNILFYRDLLRYLPPDQPVYGLQAKGLDGKEAPITSLAEMAAHYIQEIRTVQPHGPYFLGGHSLGGIVVFEIASQLYAQGEKVAILVIFDTEAPNFRKLAAVAESAVSSNLINKISAHLRQLSKLELKEKINYVWERLEWNLKLGKFNIIYKFYLRYIKRAVAELPLLDVAKSNIIAARNYIPSVYPGKLTLFFSTDRDKKLEPNDDLGWNSIVTGGVELQECPGKHTTVMQEPNVKVMAEKLIICLRQAQIDHVDNKL